jgi:Rps23 Pro-64 3,4-dihydroxylase Tpa1-like proline 4-hydroxylase
MPFLTLGAGRETAFFDDSIATIGARLHAQYRAGQPFPHVVIDDFLPESVLDRLLAEWPTGEAQIQYHRGQERLKSQYNPEELSSTFARSLFYAFNGAPFLKFVEAVTGIAGLLGDPDYNGGGYHEIKSGGHLSVHADFNVHQRLRLLRRVNVIVYLNRDWKAEYGGNLELWSKDMKARVKSVEPLFNRCVIFNTGAASFHGHPDPLSTPDGKTRRSLALYYYTASDAILDEYRYHTTLFQVRPNSADEAEDKHFVRDLLLDLTPPFVKRVYHKIVRRKR